MALDRLTVQEIKDSILQKLERNYGCDITDATKNQIYDALAQTVRDEVMKRRTAYRGANTFHNANRLTFHRFEHWRDGL